MDTKIRAEDLARQASTKVRVPAVPYVYGGRSDQGTDCINLVIWCILDLGGVKGDIANGSNTAWRSNMQWKGEMGQAVSEGKLVPGSLVYSKSAPTEKWPDGDYGHVGIYTGERPEFPPGDCIVHASRKTGVCTCPMQRQWSHVAWPSCVDYSRPGVVTENVPAAPVPAAPMPDFIGPAQATALYTPSPAPAGRTFKARVITPVGSLNIRKRPETIANNRIAKVDNGSTVDVLEFQGEWSRIRYGSVIGWAQSEFLSRIG